MKSLKRLFSCVLFVLLMLCAYTSQAQTLDTTRNRTVMSANPGWSWVGGDFRYLLKPPTDTFKLAQRDSGAIARLDSSLYTWTGKFWKKISGSGGGAGAGTLTNLTATDKTGISWTITDPTTTPNLDLSISVNRMIRDSAVLATPVSNFYSLPVNSTIVVFRALTGNTGVDITTTGGVNSGTTARAGKPFIVANQDSIYKLILSPYAISDSGTVNDVAPRSWVMIVPIATQWYKVASGTFGQVDGVKSVAMSIGTSGTDVNVTGSPITNTGTLTVNIPDASPTARGLITAATQQIGGAKIFNGTYTPSSKLAYSLLLNGTLSATANNDTLSALEINPQYNVGSFTGVLPYGFRIWPLQNQIGQMCQFASGNTRFGTSPHTALDGGFMVDVAGTFRSTGAATFSSTISVAGNITTSSSFVVAGSIFGSGILDLVPAAGSTANFRGWDYSSAGTLGNTYRSLKSPSATITNGSGTYINFVNNNQPGTGAKSIGELVFWQKNPASSSVEGVFELTLPWKSNPSTAKLNTPDAYTVIRATGKNVTIGPQSTWTAVSDPDSSTVLDVRATSQGVRLAAQTGAQVEAIPTPIDGMEAYATSAGSSAIDRKGKWLYDGSNWNKVAYDTKFITVSDADYTIASGVTDVLYTSLTAARTLTLPSASSNVNRKITIKHGGNGAFNINLSTAIRENSTTTTSSISTSGWVTIISNGTEWYIISKN